MAVKTIYRVQCSGWCFRYLSDVNPSTDATHWTTRASSALAFYDHQRAVQADQVTLKDGLCPRCLVRKERENAAGKA